MRGGRVWLLAGPTWGSTDHGTGGMERSMSVGPTCQILGQSHAPNPLILGPHVQ